MSVAPSRRERLDSLQQMRARLGAVDPQAPPENPDSQTSGDAPQSAATFMAAAAKNDEAAAKAASYRDQRNKLMAENEELRNAQVANPNQGTFSKLVEWGTKNPKDARQAFIIGFIVILSLVLLGYFTFGSSEACGTANKQNIEDIDAKVGHDGYMISFIINIKSAPSGKRNLVTIARDADLSKSDWLKTNAVEVTVDSNRYITIQQYKDDPDSPSEVTFDTVQLPLTRTDVRIMVAEGTATIKLTVPGSVALVQAKPFVRYGDTVHMRTMKMGDKNLMDQGRATISSVLVYGYEPKKVLVDACYE